MESNRFDGERLDSKSTLARNNLVEHLARYRLVKGIKQKMILDIGCGTGSGSAVLAGKFKKVIGIDISNAAITYAKRNWKRKNVEFLVGSGTKIPFPNNFFDVVAGFEVIEHIKDWKRFLKELKRVTKNKGAIYLSTPNKEIYSPGTKKPINPHHFFEFTLEQFIDALSHEFIIKEIMGQRTPIYNDHWIWLIVEPFLQASKSFLPYKFNNTIKLKIINWIKPQLDPQDVVFVKNETMIRKSRNIVAICKNKK